MGRILIKKLSKFSQELVKILNNILSDPKKNLQGGLQNLLKFLDIIIFLDHSRYLMVYAVTFFFKFFFSILTFHLHSYNFTFVK